MMTWPSDKDIYSVSEVTLSPNASQLSITLHNMYTSEDTMLRSR